MDWTFPYNADTFRTLDVQERNPTRFAEVMATLHGKNCGTLRDGSPWPCRVHKYFVSPAEPFQGMWMATRQQFYKYMAHPYWNKTGALTAPLHLSRQFGYPERSNSIYILIDIPDGYVSTCMVPLIYTGTGAAQLALVADVEHLRNGYSNDGDMTEHGKLPLVNALQALGRM
jgi:hypothetical protein